MNTPQFIQSCAGGWCRQRQKCAHYYAEDRSEPVERLCAKGLDEPVIRAPLIGADDPRWWQSVRVAA